MTLSAYLGVAGLTDIGYWFYKANETASGSRVTAGVVDAGDGWYSVTGVTLPSDAESVRWDSAANTNLIAREYFSTAAATVDNSAIAAAVWQVLVSTLTSAGTVGKLVADNLDATVSSRSTYAGTDTAGTTTLLSRIASALTITSGKVDVNDKTGFSLTGAYDPAKTAAQVGSAMTLTTAYDPAKTAASQSSINAIDDFVDTEVGAIKTVTDKLDTAMEIDGAVYRFTVNALEQAPVGGGGGATDWSAPEREQIRYRLGLDGTASAPAAANPIASQSSVDAITTKTNNLPDDPADASDIAADFVTVNGKLDAISAGGGVDPGQIADAVLTRDWALISGEASDSLLNAVRAIRNKWVVGEDGILKVYKEDGTTLAWQRTVQSTVNAVPIVGQD